MGTMARRISRLVPIARCILASVLAACLLFATAIPASAAGPGRAAAAAVGAVTPADAHDPGDDFPEGASVTSVGALPFSADRSLAYDVNADPEALDYDFFRVNLIAGTTYRFTANGVDLGSGAADPMIDIGESSEVTGPVPAEWHSIIELGNARTDTTTADVYYTARTTGAHLVWVQDDWHTLLEYPGGSYHISIQQVGVIPAGSIDRVDGVTDYPPAEAYSPSDRYGVAAALAETVAESTQPTTVIIASGLEKAAADALAAGSLSGTYNAPIILVRNDTAAWSRRLPAATAKYLLKLKNRPSPQPIRFMICGGPASVPDTLKSVILAASPPGSTFVARFGGADRYAVAASIAARVRSIAGTSTVFITNGQLATYFYDTLAVSALCASRRIPVLLSKATVVPPATLTEARRYGKKVIVGDDVALQAAALTALGMSRDPVSGAVTGGDWIGYSRADWGSYDRGYMARLVAEYGSAHGMASGSRIAVANALADSLAGGAAIGRRGGTLVFTDSDMMDPEMTEGWLITNRASSSPSVMVVGGSASVEPGVIDRIWVLVGLGIGG
jgi:hypothetical protein